MKQMLISSFVLLFSSLNLSAEDIPPSWENLPVTPSERSGGNKDKENASNGNPIHRAPQRIILPEVYYDAGQACLHILTTEEENEVAYIIKNEEEGTSASGVTVKREGYHDIDLSFLPCGDYTLILEIAGYEYSAQITL